MANIERLKQVLQLIKENPEHWNQSRWHCGTNHCFAGFADCLASNIDFRTDTNDIFKRNYTCYSFSGKNIAVRDIATNWLELSKRQAEHLFLSRNSFKELEVVIEKIELGEL